MYGLGALLCTFDKFGLNDARNELDIFGIVISVTSFQIRLSNGKHRQGGEEE